MWKIVVGFVVFAALSMYVIISAGDKADMGGEKHGADAVHAPDNTPANNGGAAAAQAPAPAASAQ